MKPLSTLFAAGAIALATTLPSLARETVSFGYLADPSMEVLMWAIQNDRVSSDTIQIEGTALDIPTLLQATVARNYDVVMTAAMALPRAMERGLDLRIIATALRNTEVGLAGNIWARTGSGITDAEGLRGRTVAVPSIGSAAATLLRISLNLAHDLDVSIPGGDITFVELPPPAMPAALMTGTIDAAQLSHLQAWQARGSNDFTTVVEADRELYDVTGLLAVSAVLAGYQSRMDADPERYHEFLRLLRASRDYALENREEVFGAVAASYNISPAYFDVWFSDYFSIPLDFGTQDRAAVEMLWTQAQALGLLPTIPAVADAAWSQLPAD